MGIDKEDIDAQNAVSGETVMITTDAVVEQFTSLDHNGVTGGDDIKLVVTNSSSVVFESITEDDHRHHRHRRRLSQKNTGILTVLVVR